MPVELTADDLRHLAITLTVAAVAHPDGAKLEKFARQFREIAERAPGSDVMWAVKMSRSDARFVLLVCQARLEAFRARLAADVEKLDGDPIAGNLALLDLERRHVQTVERQVAQLEAHLRKPVSRQAILKK